MHAFFCHHMALLYRPQHQRHGNSNHTEYARGQLPLVFQSAHFEPAGESRDLAQNTSKHRRNPVQENVIRIQPTFYKNPPACTRPADEGAPIDPTTLPIPKISSTISDHTKKLSQYAAAHHVLALLMFRASTPVCRAHLCHKWTGFTLRWTASGFNFQPRD